jgi:nucleotide-binding universal stress UspA family protein
MQGTLVCGVNDREDGGSALELAADLSGRLGLRLVLVHVADGIGPIGSGDEESESVSMKAEREGSARLLSRLASEYGVADRVEYRQGVGDAAAVIGQFAAEEAADLIVVGARSRGRFRRGLMSQLAGQLRSETPVPVVIAPPEPRRPGRW